MLKEPSIKSLMMSHFLFVDYFDTFSDFFELVPFFFVFCHHLDTSFVVKTWVSWSRSVFNTKNQKKKNFELFDSPLNFCSKAKLKTFQWTASTPKNGQFSFLRNQFYQIFCHALSNVSICWLPPKWGISESQRKLWCVWCGDIDANQSQLCFVSKSSKQTKKKFGQKNFLIFWD